MLYQCSVDPRSAGLSCYVRAHLATSIKRIKGSALSSKDKYSWRISLNHFSRNELESDYRMILLLAKAGGFHAAYL